IQIVQAWLKKAEIRNPTRCDGAAARREAEGNPKSECNNFRTSDFGLPSDFDLRISGFLRIMINEPVSPTFPSASTQLRHGRTRSARAEWSGRLCLSMRVRNKGCGDGDRTDLRPGRRRAG